MRGDRGFLAFQRSSLLAEVTGKEDTGLRLAVFGDVHGDIGALEAVLADAARRGVDEAVHLGDLAGGEAPERVIERIRREGIPGVRGDADVAAVEGDGVPEGAARYLEGLPAWMGVEDGPLRILFVHAGPRGPDRVPDARGWERWMASQGAQVVVRGHTHRSGTLSIGNRTVLNPGAVSRRVAAGGVPSYLVVEIRPELRAWIVRVSPG